MPTFTQKEVEEINEIIKAIQSAIKPKMEIGARDKVVLMGLLQDVPRSRFSGGQQTAVFLL
jgi:hypothetical protein